MYHRGRGGGGRGRGGVGARLHQPTHGEEHPWGAGRRARSVSDDDSPMCLDRGGLAGSVAELRAALQSLDGANYGSLRRLTRQRFHLHDEPGTTPVTASFLRIQPDPYAPGSQISLSTTLALTRSDLNDLLLRQPEAGCELPRDTAERVAACAIEDFVMRAFVRQLQQLNEPSVEVARVSQHVLPRDAVRLSFSADHHHIPPDSCLHANVCLYFRVKLPGHGRRVDGRGIARILLATVASAGRSVAALSTESLLSHAASVLNQEWLRAQLSYCGLVAFVRSGAVLARADGIDDTPMPANEAVCFESPPSLAKSFALPYTSEVVAGMGLPVGLTLIAGGGYHGKSTLLRALELGVYNHVPGDGREFVVVDPTAVKIRAEDRRYVDGVDVSAFINHLPSGTDTTTFSTTSASGSTSQAAAIAEALELGCHTLLLDEDTSATNFMFRDPLMSALVPDRDEPITPFVKRVRGLVERQGCSVIMVVGGSGQYFALADVVLVMRSYHAVEKTEEARRIAASAQQVADDTVTVADTQSAFSFPGQRAVQYRASFAALRDDQRGREHGRMSGSGVHQVRVGSDSWVDLSLVEQLVEEGQTNALAQSIALLYDLQTAEHARAWRDRQISHGATQLTRRPLSDFGQFVYACHHALGQADLYIQTPSCGIARGFSTMPRVFELGAALNRMRGLRTVPL